MGLSWRRMFPGLKFEAAVCLGSVAGVAGGEGGRDWRKEPRVLWEHAERGARCGLGLREHAGIGGRGARREATAIIRDISAASAKVGRESQGPRGRGGAEGAASRPQEPTSPGETAGAHALFPQTSSSPILGLKGRWEGQG